MKFSICASVATLGPIGYLVAPGTIATLVTMPCMCIVHAQMTQSQYLIFLLLVLLIAKLVIDRALEYFKNFNDPSQVVLDEFVGCLITFYAVPLSWQTLLLGFILFRFFDITKWFGIAQIERVAGAWGVLLDDVLAAVLANVILQSMCYFVVRIV